MKSIFKSILLSSLLIPVFAQSAAFNGWFTKTFVGGTTNLENHKGMCELREKLRNKEFTLNGFNDREREAAVSNIATVLAYDQTELGNHNKGIFNEKKDVPAHPSNCDVIFNFATRDWYRINDKNVAYRGSFLQLKSSSKIDLIAFNLSDVITPKPTVPHVATGVVTGCAVAGIAAAFSFDKTVMAAAGITGGLLATWGLSKARSGMIKNAKNRTFTRENIENFLNK